MQHPLGDLASEPGDLEEVSSIRSRSDRGSALDKETPAGRWRAAFFLFWTVILLSSVMLLFALKCIVVLTLNLDVKLPKTPKGLEVQQHMVHHDQAYGSCVMQPSAGPPLRWESNPRTADKICCQNRNFVNHFLREGWGYWESTSFRESNKISERSHEVTFYDVASGLPVFIAPRGRSWITFLTEWKYTGWPSFRDAEVVWENVVVLPDGETASVNGTHLGHNLPDGRNRYHANLVCISAPGPRIPAPYSAPDDQWG